MQYIVRSARYKDRYWTVPAEALHVSFKALHRRVGEVTGLGPIMEKSGEDKSTVTLSARAHLVGRGGTLGERSGVLDAKGATGSLSHIDTRLTQRNNIIRILPDEAEEILAEHDAEIERIREELGAARKRRAEAVADLWKRSAKVPIHDLEEKARA